MQAISTAYENFVFKAFKPWGRASRSEFWFVMPVIWAAILGFLVMDLNTIWGELRQRQVPALNPLDYGSVLLFVISWPSRISLTMRRLHDSGRSGRWAFVPYQAMVLSFWFTIGITAAAVAANPEEGLGAGAAIFGLGAILARFDAFWPFMFEVAQQVDIWTLLDTVRQMVGEMLGHVHVPDPATLTASYSETYGVSKVDGAKMTAVVLALTFGPVILMGLWLLFLLLPGNSDSNRFGDPSDPGVAPTAPGKGKHNPYEGYAYLLEGGKTAKADPEARRAEVMALYRQRVLGEPE